MQKKEKLFKFIRMYPEFYTQANALYSITINVFDRKPYFLEYNFTERIIDCLCESRKESNCVVIVYCFMPDHLHLITSPQNEGISILDFINKFKGRSTKIARDVLGIQYLWQRRYFDHKIRDNEDLNAQILYILNNPVRKGIVQKYEDYRYSKILDSLPF
jgi:REP element-mobilizing transposase RayT